MTLFDQSSTSSDLVRAEKYLGAGHDPDTPVGRTQEINKIASAMEPLTRRRTPQDLLVYGPAGVGKTSCIRHVFDELDDQSRVNAIYINCWQYNTRPSLLTELLIQLGYPAPRKGKPVDELLSKLAEWLDKNRGVAVALDEFDQLDDRTEVVYDLQMINKQADNPLGVVMVSNIHPSQLRLDPRSESRLSCQTLEFSTYNADQLQAILRKRVEQAFRSKAVSKEALELIATYTADQGGDCRDALNLLRQARKHAEDNDTGDITAQTIQTLIQ